MKSGSDIQFNLKSKKGIIMGFQHAVKILVLAVAGHITQFIINNNKKKTGK